MPAACVGEKTSLQFSSVLTEAKLTSCQHGYLCKAKQVLHELKTAQVNQVWKAKQGTSQREVSCEVETQPHLSHEDKVKAPLSVGSVAHATSTRGTQSPLSREAELEPQGREASLASPN